MFFETIMNEAHQKALRELKEAQEIVASLVAENTRLRKELLRINHEILSSIERLQKARVDKLVHP